MKNTYSVSREEAAAKLGVSTRTLDRWLKNGKLKNKAIGRKVFVHDKELEKLIRRESKKRARHRKSTERSDRQSDTLNTGRQSEEQVYRKLYEEAAIELKQKQEKLEAAHFRVGQLETEVKNSVPLLEYRQEKDHLIITNHKLKDELSSQKIKVLALWGGLTILIVAIAFLGVIVLN